MSNEKTITDEQARIIGAEIGRKLSYQIELSRPDFLRAFKDGLAKGFKVLADVVRESKR